MADVLSSWKEIAAYFGKGVRTVQRWEHELGLPIHRPNESDKGVVLAYPRELKDWMSRTSQFHQCSKPICGGSDVIPVLAKYHGGGLANHWFVIHDQYSIVKARLLLHEVAFFLRRS